MSKVPRLKFYSPDKLEINDAVKRGYETLVNGTGEGANMRGWMNWAAPYLKSEEYARLKKTADYIIKNFQHAIVIGIGGSYLGAKAIIDAEYVDVNAFDLPWRTNVHFVASLSSKEWNNIEHIIENDSFCIIYISKSGTTLEPNLALRHFYELHKKLHDKEPTVYAITDKSKGTGHDLAVEHGWEVFVIPDNIGGRFSVFTPVGLLPIAVAGIDTDAILNAVAAADKLCSSTIDNPAVDYANWRFEQYINGCIVEMMPVNNPELRSFAEWWKQLYGESEGKNFEGMVPHSAVFSMDLHSLGQYLQEGLRGIMCETFFTWEDSIKIKIPDSDLKDGLDYLVDRSLSEVNKAAMEGSYFAHSSIGETPNACSKFICSAGIESLAYAMQIFEWACPIGCYALDLNPFNQPGVEAYKKQVKSILAEGKVNS